jgi:ABC-type spermidine/putrescine transport system permease subunit II
VRRRRFGSAGIFGLASGTVSAGLGYAALALLYFPVAGLAVLSFSERPLSGIPWPLTVRWYHDIFTPEGSSWLEPMGTSVAIALVVAVLSTMIALAIGRMLPVIRRRGGLLAAYLCVLVMPGLLVGIAILIIYRGLLDLRTGLWSVALVHLVWALPFALLCILLVTVRFDHRLLEAAKDLGASPWRRFRDIELPLLKPGISASMFFSFLLSFNELPRTIYVRGGVETLPYYIWTASAAHSSQVALIYALSAIIMVASFALTAVAMRMLNREPRS